MAERTHVVPVAVTDPGQGELDLPRRKARILWLAIRYRAYRVSLKLFGGRFLLRWWLNSAWISKRIAGELAGRVYGEEFSAEAGTLSADLLLDRIQDNMRVVDIGCGTGHWVRVASERAGYVLGVDLNPGAIEEAQRRGVPANGEFRVDDARSVADENPFDLGLLIHTLEHLDRPVEFLRDLRTVCKRLLVEVPDLENDSLNHLRRHLGLPFYHDADHVREYTEKTLLQELRSGGWNANLLRKRHGAMLVEAVPV